MIAKKRETCHELNTNPNQTCTSIKKENNMKVSDIRPINSLHKIDRSTRHRERQAQVSPSSTNH